MTKRSKEPQMKKLAATLGVALTVQLGLAIAGVQAQPAPGAAFGAREPTPCPSRKLPGRPTAAQALALVVCDDEKYAAGYEYLVSGVTVQIGKSRPYSAWSDSGHTDIDVTAPVWPIQGSISNFQCSRRDAMLGQDPDRNCLRTDSPQATGTCYENTFGEWHCAMAGAGTWAAGYQPPPR